MPQGTHTPTQHLMSQSCNDNNNTIKGRPAATKRHKATQNVRQKTKQSVVVSRRMMMPILETVCIAIAACVALVTITTQQSAIQQGIYVKLHGLNNKQYNGWQ